MRMRAKHGLPQVQGDAAVKHAHAHVHVNMTHMRAPVMPTVKRSRGKACVFPAARFGIPAARLSNTALAMAGVKSLLPRP
jgi:hypothetical protein